jgi:hypothetical protein
MSTLTDYRLIARDMPRWRTITNAQPAVALQTKHFLQNIGNVKTPADLVRDTRLFNFAMEAFGLGDRLYAKALVRKVLEEGVSRPDALANKLNDPRIKALARAFDFARNGERTTQSAALRQDVVARFVDQTLQSEQGKSNPGVRLALYFQQNAPNISSVYGILADRDLLTVVQTKLGISPMTSHQNIDLQAKTIAARLDIADFRNPKKLQTFVEHFAAAYDARNGPTSPTGASAAALFDQGSQTFGIGLESLLSLQKVKLNGR